VEPLQEVVTGRVSTTTVNRAMMVYFAREYGFTVEDYA
jgi:hypothetical protein